MPPGPGILLLGSRCVGQGRCRAPLVVALLTGTCGWFLILGPDRAPLIQSPVPHPQRATTRVAPTRASRCLVQLRLRKLLETLRRKVALEGMVPAGPGHFRSR